MGKTKRRPRKRRDETEEEEEEEEAELESATEARKRLRRERNKEAAARCRKRKVDLTNKLQAEVAACEMVKAAMQSEIEALRVQVRQITRTAAIRTPDK